ncbi:hypothetical protein GCM10011515_19230 [Tsuneonella deserti]|uniref:MPN domain-containing protein n=1 Tax=Tsuneonella deserti TaxID=2035528 RepID=A0ABQ1SB52_9SPHN|nr:JAB domain-containing protein [Tsuneonella deserti]GGD99555.1 hypothetical protein GCM10011515_19230 [Tsuneonella deserti]
MARFLAPYAGEAAEGLAERLIARFGSLTRMLDAPVIDLRAAMTGYEAAADGLHAAREMVRAALAEGLPDAIVDSSDPAIHRFLQDRIGGAHEERLHAIFADAQSGYLADETMVSGTARRMIARARPLMERAMSLGAAGILLAHNHPSGWCRPSEEDVAATRWLAGIAEALELTLIDHLIVTRRQVFSMRLAGCF